MQNVHKENKTLDIFKVLACVIVTPAHLPSICSTVAGDVYYNQWFLRFCVPFFFICSGYFFCGSAKKEKNLKRIAWLFALSYLLYLPAVLEGAQSFGNVVSKLRWNLLIGYEHLWYLSAAFEAMILWYLLEKIPVIRDLFRRLAFPGCVLLFLTGALLDEHYHLLNNPILTAAGDFLMVFGGPRNVVFMGFPLMIFGGYIYRHQDTLRKIPTVVLLGLWVLLRGLAYWECTYLYQNLGASFTADMTFFGSLPALVLFLLSFRFEIPVPIGISRLLRRMTEYVYILHPLVATLISKYLHLEPIPLWIATVAMCSCLYYLLEKQFVIKK